MSDGPSNTVARHYQLMREGGREREGMEGWKEGVGREGEGRGGEGEMEKGRETERDGGRGKGRDTETEREERGNQKPSHKQTLPLLTIFLSSSAHFLNICSERPAWSIPGVANTTMGPGLSMYDRSNGCSHKRAKS